MALTTAPLTSPFGYNSIYLVPIPEYLLPLHHRNPLVLPDHTEDKRSTPIVHQTKFPRRHRFTRSDLGDSLDEPQTTASVGQRVRWRVFNWNVVP